MFISLHAQRNEPPAATVLSTARRKGTPRKVFFLVHFVFFRNCRTPGHPACSNRLKFFFLKLFVRTGLFKGVGNSG